MIRDATDVAAAVKLLSDHFRIPVPTVVVSRGRRSWTRWSRRAKRSRIVVGLRDWHGLEQATLHETTHAVAYHRFGRHVHGDEFFITLCEIARLWLGDPSTYTWHKEYRTLWARAHAQGLTRERWFGDERRRQARERQAEPMVRPGDTVTWDSPRYGRMSGQVRSARPGYRARVETPDGQRWYVPQSFLRTPRSPVSCADRIGSEEET